MSVWMNKKWAGPGDCRPAHKRRTKEVRDGAYCVLQKLLTSRLSASAKLKLTAPDNMRSIPQKL
jgi:hypothetical protein